MGREQRSHRNSFAVIGVAFGSVAVPVAAWLSATSLGQEWTNVVEDDTGRRMGAWRAMRGGFAFLANPTLLLLLGLMLWVAFRRSPRHAWVLAGIAVAGNVGTQLVKHAPFGLGEHWQSLNPLSGHVAVVASICLGWLVVAPPRLQLRTSMAAVGAMVGVSSGVVLAGWHSPLQVLCPLMISLGCAMIGAAALGAEITPPEWSRPRVGLLGVLVVGGLAACVIASELVTRSAGRLASQPGLAVGSAVLAAVGPGAAAVAVLLALVGGTAGVARVIPGGRVGAAA